MPLSCQYNWHCTENKTSTLQNSPFVFQINRLEKQHQNCILHANCIPLNYNREEQRIRLFLYFSIGGVWMGRMQNSLYEAACQLIQHLYLFSTAFHFLHFEEDVSLCIPANCPRYSLQTSSKDLTLSSDHTLVSTETSSYKSQSLTAVFFLFSFGLFIDRGIKAITLATLCTWVGFMCSSYIILGEKKILYEEGETVIQASPLHAFCLAP